MLRKSDNVHAGTYLSKTKFIARGGESMTPMTVLISILLTLLGLVVGYYVRKTIAEAKIAGARGAAEQILEDAKRDAEALKKALLEAKDEIHTLRIDAEQEVRERRNELQNKKTVYFKKKKILTVNTKELINGKRCWRRKIIL